MDELAAAGGVGGPVALLRVRFTPGARTAWHCHPAGQVLHVLDGTGRVQERGGPVREIRQGDTVTAAPDVWHWHGAGPETFMTHLAAQGAGPAGDAAPVWGEHVTDEEYDGRTR